MQEPLKINLAGGIQTALPKMYRVNQSFNSQKLDDIPQAIVAEFKRPEIAGKVKPGQRIAVGGGSRGVANIGLIIQTVVKELVALGAKPFVFPAMGSHGSATADGQKGVLASYGITEDSLGVPVEATMDTVVVDTLEDGTEVHMDRLAHEADGVVLVNRIKPHTSFRGKIESGIIKMMVIGMGKIKGASAIHTHGMDVFPELLPKVATRIMAKTPFLFGVGVIENGYDETAVIEALPGETLLEREAVLQDQAKTLMGRIYFDDIDVLVIEQMGKNISGAGFDPNITGRNHRGAEGFDLPRVKKIVVLDLTPETHGNATGVGMADVITRKLFKQIDFGATYANVITSAYLDGGMIPLVMNTVEDAIKVAAMTVPRVPSEKARIVRIKNTLHLDEIEISEALVQEAEAHPNLKLADASGGRMWAFNAEGELQVA